MSFLLTPFTELLSSYGKASVNEDLWLVVVQTLTKSFLHDEGGTSSAYIQIFRSV